MDFMCIAMFIMRTITRFYTIEMKNFQGKDPQPTTPSPLTSKTLQC